MIKTKESPYEKIKVKCKECRELDNYRCSKCAKRKCYNHLSESCFGLCDETLFCDECSKYLNNCNICEKIICEACKTDQVCNDCGSYFHLNKCGYSCPCRNEKSSCKRCIDKTWFRCKCGFSLCMKEIGDYDHEEEREKHEKDCKREDINLFCCLCVEKQSYSQYFCMSCTRPICLNHLEENCKNCQEKIHLCKECLIDNNNKCKKCGCLLCSECELECLKCEDYFCKEHYSKKCCYN